MLKEIKFKRKKYKLILTKHALERMEERDISRSLVEEVIESGDSLQKKTKGKWWVYKKIKGRVDNDICLSISIEDPNLIVITTLINWRPKKWNFHMIKMQML